MDILFGLLIAWIIPSILAYRLFQYLWTADFAFTRGDRTAAIFFSMFGVFSLAAVFIFALIEGEITGWFRQKFGLRDRRDEVLREKRR